jgi:DNA-binding phage protein
LIVNIKALSELADKEGPVKLARTIGVGYPHLYRVLRNEKNAGLRMISGIQRMCRVRGLNVDDYIFFDELLSGNNEISVTKEAV